MTEYTEKDRSIAPEDADFSVLIDGRELEPYIKSGETVYAVRKAQLLPGDVGIFYYDGGMLIRQYCEDSFGGIYLFCLNRGRRKNDIFVPANSRKRVCCFGKVILGRDVPLPND